MTWRITKSFTFSASHVLGHLPEDHPCSRLHGHNYSVELEFQSYTTDGVGMILDYRKLDGFGDWLKDKVDHRHLNDLVDFNPTAELLASWLYQQVYEWMVLRTIDTDLLTAVRVMETAKTMAEYRGPRGPKL